MRKVLIPVAVIALAIAAAAIGGRSEEAAAATGNCAKANLNLVKDGQLSIGTDNPAFPPWFAGGETKGRPWKINDPAKGKGFESAVAYAVARRLGFTKNQVVWVYTPFNKAIAPGKKGYDFDINQISYTPERAKVLAFSAVVLQRQPVDRRPEGQADLVGALGRRTEEVQAGRPARDDELPVHRREHQAGPRRSPSTTRTTRPLRH